MISSISDSFVSKIGWDKLVHCTISGWLCMILIIITNNIFISTLSILAIGVFKEIYDKIIGKEFDIKDLLANVIGIFISLIICLL